MRSNRCRHRRGILCLWLRQSNRFTNAEVIVAAYWRSVIDINEYQKDRFIKRIVACLFRTLTNKKVAILAYAYKKDTGDMRESAAISIVNNLLSENAEVSIYDPKVEEEAIWLSLKEGNVDFKRIKTRVTICSSNKSEKANMSTDDEPNLTSEEVQSSLKRWQPKSSSPLSKVHTDPELLRPLTDKAEEGKRLDWTHIARLMRRPMSVFGGRNVVDVAKLEQLGFYVESIGKPGVSSRMN
ncbi:hypothetical protein OEA41_008468 [Lepraria neglecta]|uniref:UDP-glucose/GDP-mannose dehydrogenase C-terminal domain-containing protein n=1 Tax=Lepraria neglecta TaxID=209136 RepID=A0AAD9ZFE4_9LECA|nr:hypothetical protein OEA41_008468 [Lepraria neglecta]